MFSEEQYRKACERFYHEQRFVEQAEHLVKLAEGKLDKERRHLKMCYQARDEARVAVLAYLRLSNSVMETDLDTTVSSPFSRFDSSMTATEAAAAGTQRAQPGNPCFHEYREFGLAHALRCIKCGQVIGWADFMGRS
jgi:hypothetical protein